MKRILIATLIATLWALVPAAASTDDKQTLRIGTEGQYPPFNAIGPDGELHGFDIDIADALCAEMGVECVFVAQDWEGIIPGLLAGRYDAIVASMSITEQRKEVVSFTQRYYFTPARFVTRNDAAIEDVSPEGLEGVTIGAQRGTIYHNYLKAKYPRSRLRLYNRQDELHLDLTSGRLDVAFSNAIPFYLWMRESDEAECCDFTGEPLTESEHFGEGAGIAVRKEDTELRDRLNKALDTILADGTYERINANYFPFSIY